MLGFIDPEFLAFCLEFKAHCCSTSTGCFILLRYANSTLDVDILTGYQWTFRFSQFFLDRILGEVIGSLVV